MQRPKIDQYFAKKGIKVHYNTLGMTEDLVRSYVTTFRPVVEKSGVVSSHLVKQACYETLYQIKTRNKMTGFEQVKSQDRAFREKIVSYIADVFYGPVLNVDQNSRSDYDYKTLLVDTLKSIDDPVLYFSGGIDSELVANALIDAKKTFRLVLFSWTDQNQNEINRYEADFAREFCKRKGFELEEYKIDVESLWSSPEFFEFAKDIQIHSTHVLTHAWAVKLLSEKYPTSTHLFGGEVRFMQDLSNPDKTADIVFLNKVNPPGYEQNLPYITESNIFFGCSIELIYVDDGTWYITYNGNLTPTLPGPTNGIWTTTPASPYEYSINGGVTWTDIVGSVTVAIAGLSGPGYVEFTWPILIRDKIGPPQSTVSSQIILAANEIGTPP